MKRLIKAVLLIIAIFCGPVISHSQEISAKTIVKKSADKLLGESSISNMTMTITRPEWSRTVSMQNWSMGNEYYIILITAPARDKGQIFMKRQQDMWNWMPTINRMIKIPPSMMMQSWMGSDFSNNDLVRENSIIVDYTHKIVGSEIIEELDCYKIELIPLPEAPVVWGKIIMYISKSEFYQLKSEYYDDYMELVSIASSSEFKKFGDRMLPAKMTISPANKKGYSTEINVTSQEFNIPSIKESFFSQQNMKRIRERK